ncbi:MAG: D-alanine--D-alanine ligase [Bacteroidales bacterium]|jgi:D-alanine-D-alanine ligase|nr:D-alanine--D-alanine ligase [Bacteroidales bacterium]
MKKNIALMAGGYSGEYSVSLEGAKQIEDNLKEDYNIYKIILVKQDWYYEKDNKKYSVEKSDFTLNIEGKKIAFDAAFIIIHGTPGENGLLQGYFEMLDIPYTTCDSLTSAITFDKVVCNAVVKDLNVVNVANNYSIYDYQKIDTKEILIKVALPVFVKPSQGGSSIGMTKVKQEKDLESAIKKAFTVHNKVIIEQGISGREFSCGVFTVDKKVVALPVTEIVSKKEFFDYQAKYEGLSDEIVPASINDELKDRIQQTTKKVYKGLNCKGVCRIDFIYDNKNDKLFFLEVNTTPGQSLHSIVPNQVRAYGKDVRWLYNQQLKEIL